MMIKKGVKLAGMRSEILLAMVIAAQVYRDVADAELVITEVTGGVHGTASLHYVGAAVDLRISNLKDNQVPAVVMGLKKKLGENYDVVLEKDHIHVEFQPK